MRNLIGLLPTVGVEQTGGGAEDESSSPNPKSHSIEARQISPATPRRCDSCGYFWKNWCAYEALTFRNIQWMTSCPRPQDEPMPYPGLEQRYGKQPLKLCRDCLVRTKCSRFVGIAWFFPGCPDFQKSN
jgi:hypothetical protein